MNYVLDFRHSLFFSIRYLFSILLRECELNRICRRCRGERLYSSGPPGSLLLIYLRISIHIYILFIVYPYLIDIVWIIVSLNCWPNNFFTSFEHLCNFSRKVSLCYVVIPKLSQEYVLNKNLTMLWKLFLFWSPIPIIVIKRC